MTNDNSRRQRIQHFTQVYKQVIPVRKVIQEQGIRIENLLHPHSRVLNTFRLLTNGEIQSSNPEEYIFIPTERDNTKDYFVKLYPRNSRSQSKERNKILQPYIAQVVSDLQMEDAQRRRHQQTRKRADTLEVQKQAKQLENIMLKQYRSEGTVNKLELDWLGSKLTRKEDMMHVGVTIILPGGRKLRITSHNKKGLVDACVKDAAKYCLFFTQQGDIQDALPVFVHKDVVKTYVTEEIRRRRMMYFAIRRGLDRIRIKDPFQILIKEGPDITGHPTPSILISPGVDPWTMRKSIHKLEALVRKRNRKEFANKLRRKRNEILSRVRRKRNEVVSKVRRKSYEVMSKAPRKVFSARGVGISESIPNASRNSRSKAHMHTSEASKASKASKASEAYNASQQQQKSKESLNSKQAKRTNSQKQTKKAPILKRLAQFMKKKETRK